MCRIDKRQVEYGLLGLEQGRREVSENNQPTQERDKRKRLENPGVADPGQLGQESERVEREENSNRQPGHPQGQSKQPSGEKEHQEADFKYVVTIHTASQITNRKNS